MIKERIKTRDFEERKGWIEIIYWANGKNYWACYFSSGNKLYSARSDIQAVNVFLAVAASLKWVGKNEGSLDKEKLMTWLTKRRDRNKESEENKNINNRMRTIAEGAVNAFDHTLIQIECGKFDKKK